MGNRHHGAAPVAAAEEYFRKQATAFADILLMTCMDWAMLYRIPLPEAYVAYRERVAQRPAFREALRRNYPDFVIEEGIDGGRRRGEGAA